MALFASVGVGVCHSNMYTTAHVNPTFKNASAVGSNHKDRYCQRRQQLQHASCDDDDDNHNDNNNSNLDDSENMVSIQDDSRRFALQSILWSTTTFAAGMFPNPALAGKPEIDGSGQLFSPKAEMLSGGSTMTRGIPLNNEKRPVKLKPGQPVQVVYEARFIAYLSRFLLNFDPAIRTWWANQGMDDSWESQSFGRDDKKENCSKKSSQSLPRVSKLDYPTTLWGPMDPMLVDGGHGYTVAPDIKVARAGSTVRCEACAIIDRFGHIESIIVLDPGYGYGQKGKSPTPPKVTIEAPKQILDFRPARAVAELEYEIAGIDIVDGGNGYVADDFPSIEVAPPLEDPDWFILEDTYKIPDLGDVLSQSYVTASVVEMRLDDGTIVDKSFRGNVLSDGMIARIRRDPLTPTSTVSLSPRYRAFDPIFGPIGRVPVTKGAMELSTSEYTRLALSGAVCTVIVRTALNPLELVKTKIQLGNDKEVNEYVLAQARQVHHEDVSSLSLEDVPANATGVEAKSEAIGTVDVLKSLIKLRE
ncbi:hypothetical protein MHU86_23248 [Fragilaria crotonensis]|nr:hypothetical protein MHU86_23248 [Fragilaria crotonensis]